MSRVRLAALSLAVLASAVSARAAEPDPLAFFAEEARQTTVSRVDEAVDEAPGSVYVFSRKTIQARGYRSLGELLRTVPGFTVFHRDLQYVAGVRGLNANDNEKISLLINGQNVNGVNEPDFLNGPINLDSVERVEVVVGPSSLFQQANTLAATVNVITRDPDGSEAVLAAGSALTYAATAMTGRRWSDDESASAALTLEQKRGFDAWNPAFRPNLAGRRVTGAEDWGSYFGVLKGRRQEWSAQAVAYRDSRPELLIDNGSPANDGRSVDQLYTVSVQNEHDWTGDLTGVTRADVINRQQTRMNESGAPVGAVQEILKQTTYEGELGLRYSGVPRHELQAGVQGSYDRNYDSWYSFDDPAASENIAPTTLVDRDARAIGFYAHDAFEVNDRLKLVGGVRADQSTRVPGRWYLGGRAAAIGHPSENWVAKLLYNRAVRMPSTLAALNGAWGSEHTSVAPSFARVSPQARSPEILQTYELQNVVYAGPFRLTASLYHQELKDFITWFSPHSNVGNFHGNGAEVSAQAPLGERDSVWANASWNDSKLALFRLPLNPAGGVETHHAYTDPSGRIIGSAEWTANLGLERRLLPRVTLAPSLRWFTNQAALDHGTGQYTTLCGRWYVDAALTWDHAAGRDADVRLTGSNLLNNRMPVASPMNGDTYRPRGVSGTAALDVRF